MGVRVESLVLGLVVWLCLCVGLEAQLQVGFYASSCPNAESIVREEVTKALESNLGLAAGLVRMHFHDCFVRGCDGSVLIDSTTNNRAEKASSANFPSLRGFEVIDSAKTRLEAQCNATVSCADILAFAARDSVFLTGRLEYSVPAGRRDGRISLASEADGLPGPGSNVDNLTQAFADKGLTQAEMVTLSGGHTIGRSHCDSFTNRLYNFSSTTPQDPSLDATYAAQLKQECPQGSNFTSLVVPMNPSTPNVIDTDYYVDVVANRGLFTSDQTLLTNNATASQVRQNAANGSNWKAEFAAAMVKMGGVGVVTGTAGEIRLNCRKIN